MISSMTGFGKFEEINEDYKLIIEIKSVNHRYLDINFKMPRKFNVIEGNIRNLLKEKVGRGKVDIYIFYESYKDLISNIRYNEEIVKSYIGYAKTISESFLIQNDLKVSDVFNLPDVISEEDITINENEIWEKVEPVLSKALERFCISRQTEGENLKNDLILKLENMSIFVSQIEDNAELIVTNYKNKLRAKLDEYLKEKVIDEARIAAEIIIYADKVCIDEEIVRLKSHIKAAKGELLKGNQVGKKLDFIAQEMNREANTILSKSASLEVSNVAIKLKTEIEKIREQIQNLE